MNSLLSGQDSAAHEVGWALVAASARGQLGQELRAIEEALRTWPCAARASVVRAQLSPLLDFFAGVQERGCDERHFRELLLHRVL